MKRSLTHIFLIAIIAISFYPSQSQASGNEIVWLKLQDEIGLGDIINSIFTPNDSTILVTDANFKLVEIDATSGSLIRTITNIKGAIKFSDDGQYLYTYGFEKVSWPSGELIGTYPVPKGGFPSIIYGEYNASFDLNEKAGLLIGVLYQTDQIPANWKRGLWVFDLNTFQLKDTIGFEKNYYIDIKITDDGKYFLTSSDYFKDYPHSDTSNLQFLWDVKTLDTLNREYRFSRYIKTSPDGIWMGSVISNWVQIFDANTFELKYGMKQAPDGSGRLTAIDISSDSRYMATCGDDGTYEIVDIHIWDLITGQLAYKYSNAENGIDQVFLHFSNTSYNIIGYGPGAIIFYNNKLTTVPENQDPIEPVLFPNPTNGNVTISNTYFQTDQLNIDLYDMNGNHLQTIYNSLYNQQDITFDISSLSHGIYIIKAIQDNSLQSFKVIKGN